MILKFVSLNIWFGGLLLEPLLQFLEQENADIVALQEVYDSNDTTLPLQYRSIDCLKERLQYPYIDFAPEFLDLDRTAGKAQRGNAILSKLPIQNRQVTFFGSTYSETYRETPQNASACPHNLQHVVLSSASQDINVFNMQGVWDLDGDNYSNERRRMSEVMIEATKGLPNVILTGDTNAKPSNQAIRNITHLTSVFGDDLKTTFNMQRKDNPGYATAAVDMIFVSPHITVLERSCPDVDISDHLPLITKLSFENRPVVL